MVTPLWGPSQSIILLASAVFGVVSLRITVDDTDPSISYFPADQWSQGATCGACTVHPDPSLSHDGTWHDTTYNPQVSGPMSISFSFTGTRVQVFNILPGAVPAWTTHTDLTFNVDGSNVGSFSSDPQGDSGFLYDQPVFSSADLENTNHTLTIQTTSGVASIVLFDYLVYTVPDNLTLPPSTSIDVPPFNITDLSSSTSGSVSSSASSSGTTSTSSTASSPTGPGSVAFSRSRETSVTDSIPSSTQFVPIIDTTTSQTVVTVISSGYIVPSANARSSTLHLATPQSRGNSASTIPTKTVIGAAIAGSFASLVLLASILYILWVRHARRRFDRSGKEDHAEGYGGARNEIQSDESCPPLATQTRSATIKRDPFVDAQRMTSQAGNGIETLHELPNPHSQPVNLLNQNTFLVAPTSPHSSQQTIVTAMGSPAISQQSTALDPTCADDDKLLLPSDTAAVSDPVYIQQSQSPSFGSARLREHLEAPEDHLPELRAYCDCNSDVLPVEAPPGYDEIRAL